MNKKQTNYLLGFDYAISNSKSLLKIASSSFKQKEYGIACSLNILAAEEAIKSFFLFFKYYFPDIDLPEFDDMFTKHKTKHYNLIWLSMFYTILVDYVYFVLLSYSV